MSILRLGDWQCMVSHVLAYLHKGIEKYGCGERAPGFPFVDLGHVYA